jgi:hypothetical protein
MKWLLIAILALPVFGGGCLSYDRPVTLKGKLLPEDEGGYRQYFVLFLDKPICTLHGAQEFEWAESDVEELQVFTGDDDSVLDRVARLSGTRVIITARLRPKVTGYHRTAVTMDVTKVEPLDTAARRALLNPRPGVVIKDAASYIAVIRTGPTLQIEVRDATNKPLKPSEEYVSRWMTGGEVLYVDCVDPYKRESADFSPKEAGSCDDILCGFSNPFEGVTKLTLRCVKRQ